MRRALLLVLAVLVAGLAVAMVSRERPFPPEPRDDLVSAHLHRTARVIFITLDGPLRDDVLSGALMPGLHEALRAQGVAFPAAVSSPVALSLPGYQVLAAGHATECRDNDCPRIEVETMAERVARRLSLPPGEVAVFASWSKLARAASSHDGTVFVDAPPDGPPVEGGPPWRNARFDAQTFARAREYWEGHHPRFLHLAFLDTDEYAHQGRREDYEQALHEADARVLEVLRWVEALPVAERAVTTVLLTADHGRGRGDWKAHGFFERGSGEVFIAALGPVVRGGEEPRADQRDLRPTVERLFGLCPAHEPDDGRALEAVVGSLPCTN